MYQSIFLLHQPPALDEVEGTGIFPLATAESSQLRERLGALSSIS